MRLSDLPLPEHLLVREHASPAVQAEALAERVAEALREAIVQRGEAVLVVSGGRSPVAFFEQLAQQPLAWAQVWVSLADERWVAVDQDASNEALVRRHLLQGEAAQARWLGLYQPAATLEEAAERADAALAELPRIDVLVLGMGDDGHTASLFPGNALLAEALSPDCDRRVLPMQAPVALQARLTLTLPILARARLSLLAIQGEAKCLTLQRALKAGPLTELPIRAFLQRPLEIHGVSQLVE